MKRLNKKLEAIIKKYNIEWSSGAYVFGLDDHTSIREIANILQEHFGLSVIPSVMDKKWSVLDSSLQHEYVTNKDMNTAIINCAEAITNG